MPTILNDKYLWPSMRVAHNHTKAEQNLVHKPKQGLSGTAKLTMLGKVSIHYYVIKLSI